MGGQEGTAGRGCMEIDSQKLCVRHLCLLARSLPCTRIPPVFTCVYEPSVEGKRHFDAGLG